MPLNLYTGLGFDFQNVFYAKLSPKEQRAYTKFVIEFDRELDDIREAAGLKDLSPGTKLGVFL